MRIVIDLDLHEAVSGFGQRTPAGTYEFKSQDTIDFWVYFVRSGIVVDMGAGFALKYGMIKVGTTTLLAYQDSISYQADSDSNPYYLAQVNMNTSQMVAAIGTSASISCTQEIRYATADGEKIHTLNIPAIVFHTILAETGSTPPDVGGSYPDVSELVLQSEVDAANGVAGLDVDGKIRTSQLDGTVELVAHKNAASGYPGLGSDSKVNVNQIPIDGTSVVVASGKLSAPLAGGDMMKATYDTVNRGYVDHSVLADSALSLSTATATGAVSLVWGKDAAGHQNLFTAPTGGGVSAISSAATDAWDFSLVNNPSGVIKALTTNDASVNLADFGTEIDISVTPKHESLSGTIETPAAKDYVLELYVSGPYPIEAVYAIVSAGTASISLIKNGTLVSGSTVSVSTTRNSATLSSQSVAVADTLALRVNSVSSSPVAKDLAFSVKVYR